MYEFLSHLLRTTSYLGMGGRPVGFDKKKDGWMDTHLPQLTL